MVSPYLYEAVIQISPRQLPRAGTKRQEGEEIMCVTNKETKESQLDWRKMLTTHPTRHSKLFLPKGQGANKRSSQYLLFLFNVHVTTVTSDKSCKCSNSTGSTASAYCLLFQDRHDCCGCCDLQKSRAIATLRQEAALRQRRSTNSTTPPRMGCRRTSNLRDKNMTKNPSSYHALLFSLHRNQCVCLSSLARSAKDLE